MPSLLECPLQKSAFRFPSHPCIVTKDRTLTFQEMDRFTSDLARHLQSVQIQEQDRLAIRAPPSIELIALFFAAWRLGASLCPLNLRIPETQTLPLLQRLGATCYFDTTFTLLPVPKSSLFSQSLCLFTSGSTFEPKIAVLSLAALMENAAHSIPLQKESRCLLSLPLFHVSGIGTVLRSILHGSTLTLDPEDPFITHISATPTHLYRKLPSYPHLQCVLVGGAPVTNYPSDLPIFLTYGLTEMGSMVLCRKAPPKIGLHYHLGSPLMNRSLRLGEDGEIWVQGRPLFSGYLEKDTLRLPIDAKGWFPTGDLGTYDDKEGWAILGRKDFLFISGGENIQPEEIERALEKHPAVEQAIILPKVDPEFGHIPVAFIKKSHPCTPKILQKHLLELLPKYKIPKLIFFVDSFPQKGLKIDRNKMKSWAN